MPFELKESIQSKFCTNCGALIQIERKDDKPEFCGHCVVFQHVIVSCQDKMRLLIARNNEAVEQLRAIHSRVRADFDRRVLVN